jgi:iron complex transport system ATP-binding protein
MSETWPSWGGHPTSALRAPQAELTTSHLDFGNQVKTLRMIKSLSERGYTIVLTSHFPDHAFHLGCRVVVMKDGYIIDEGTADEVVTEENLRKVYGVGIKIIYSDDLGSKVCIPVMK